MTSQQKLSCDTLFITLHHQVLILSQRWKQGRLWRPCRRTSIPMILAIWSLRPPTISMLWFMIWWVTARHTVSEPLRQMGSSVSLQVLGELAPSMMKVRSIVWEWGPQVLVITPLQLIILPPLWIVVLRLSALSLSMPHSMELVASRRIMKYIAGVKEVTGSWGIVHL